MRHALLLLLLLLLVSCGDSPEQRYDKIATGFCECTGRLAEMNRQYAELANDSTGRALTALQDMQAEYNKAKECSAAIISQFGKLKPEEYDAVQKALAGKCPEMTEQQDLLQEMLGEQ
ncbi:MAG: hypothetical protein JNL02_00200 [Saprospiraceae bacterium]|nr:hypothetical protein [Saprospiraceae bacterium]